MAQAIPSSEDVRIYECAVVYPFPMNQKEENDLQKGIEEIFSEAEAKLLLKDVWGRRGLAYKIGGYTEGNFVVYYYEMDPSKLKDVDTQLRILKGVLRHMMIKPPKTYEIAPMADTLTKWKEQTRMDSEKKAQDKEDKLKKQVVEKAKRAKPEKKKMDDEKPMPTETIAEGLDKLISDKDLEI